MTVTTRSELDALICEQPGCDADSDAGLYVSCLDHPEATSLVFYVRGEVKCECALCGRTYACLAVAE
jgi:hypothetical protein